MKLTDLSHPFTITDMVFPGTQLMSCDRTHNCKEHGYNLTMCNINTHAGTHTDAPLHFLEDGKSLVQVELERYVGTCFVVNCTHKGYANAMLQVEDVKPYEEQIKKAERVIFATGWSKEFNTEKFFTEYPSVSTELAKYLVSLGIKMMGVEGPSVNTIDGAEVHKILLGADVAIVEALTNTEQVVNREIIFCGAPLAFTDMDGFPLRAYAIEP
ncbi:MAG: cyclase family protein [Clostridia bacterium]|nr:cyclase family protein [Clostridia bacterium]